MIEPWQNDIDHRHLVTGSEQTSWPITTCARVQASWKNTHSQTLHHVTARTHITKTIQSRRSHRNPHHHQSPIKQYGKRTTPPAEESEKHKPYNHDKEYTYEVGSDGSVKHRRGTFAWVATNENEKLYGGGEIPAAHTDLHPF